MADYLNHIYKPNSVFHKQVLEIILANMPVGTPEAVKQYYQDPNFDFWGGKGEQIEFLAPENSDILILEWQPGFVSPGGGSFYGLSGYGIYEEAFYKGIGPNGRDRFDIQIVIQKPKRLEALKDVENRLKDLLAKGYIPLSGKEARRILVDAGHLDPQYVVHPEYLKD